MANPDKTITFIIEMTYEDTCRIMRQAFDIPEEYNVEVHLIDPELSIPDFEEN